MTEQYKRPEEKSLRRVLGLPSAITIGLGIMIGAGIFIFPGLAGGRAGIGAAVSFALAGAVAFIIALCMAELATAMPRSGGAYYFISRGMGAFWGTVVGISLWIGLIFATGFYLVAFGHYLAELLMRAGILSRVPDVLCKGMGFLGVALLTWVNLIGAEKVGRLQKIIVYLLLLIIAGVLVVGLLDSLGITREVSVYREMPPDPLKSILGTSALIFTSYLGFAQIANVSGEIKKPERNLPIALGGSVLLAAMVYILTMVVITGEYSIERLGQLGETAMVNLGEALLNGPGIIIITIAGLLATISSANASILSSSRILFALGKDRMVPQATTRISGRYGVPWVTVLLVGIPAAGVIFLCDIELLAQMASFLHLVMYAMVCISLTVLRRTNPKFYTPSFRVPFYIPLSAVGVLGCLAIVLFMSRMAQVAGAVLLGAGVIWFAVYASGRQTRRSRKK